MLKFFSEKTCCKVSYKEALSNINALEEKVKLLTRKQLRKQILSVKEKLVRGDLQERFVPEVFAILREVSFRTLNLRLYDVQIIGGLVLLEGKIAEMRTGEGKTLAALLPTFFNALYGKGVQVITANDYLASRDAKYLRPVYLYLGFKVGFVGSGMPLEQRKRNYACDAVYLTHHELGFDYLRDNMALDKINVVQRAFYFCVVDEVDSILIDEAATPLVISGNAETSKTKYENSLKIANVLRKNVHYVVNEKLQTLVFLREGVDLCENLLGISNLFSLKSEWAFFIMNSLKAKELFHLNVHYMVSKSNEVVIIDEYTGRLLPGRRWSSGLHQFVEAKEKISIQKEHQMLASLTYQALFLLYHKFSGMTGTAKTESVEFRTFYHLEVVVVPTHRPVLRQDFPNVIHGRQDKKWKAVVEECASMNKKGRPVLIGTSTVKNSELLSVLLKDYGLTCALLNARPENVKNESDIIAQAGRKHAITIATNMAGRGTDIVLGGSCDYNKKEQSRGFKSRSNLEVLKLGGLHVIGTELHDSKRIDNQLRGRAGRQGDPGSSRFFLSLEDKLPRLSSGGFCFENLELINKSWLFGFTNFMALAQKKIEISFFETRKNLFEYDKVLSAQRNLVYLERRKILAAENLEATLLAYSGQSLLDVISFLSVTKDAGLKHKMSNVIKYYLKILGPSTTLEAEFNSDLFLNFLNEQVLERYKSKELQLESKEVGLMRTFEKGFLLQIIDYS